MTLPANAIATEVVQLLATSLTEALDATEARLRQLEVPEAEGASASWDAALDALGERLRAMQAASDRAEACAAALATEAEPTAVALRQWQARCGPLR